VPEIGVPYIIEAHGGRLREKANAPQGTFFQFTLRRYVFLSAEGASDEPILNRYVRSEQRRKTDGQKFETSIHTLKGFKRGENERQRSIITLDWDTNERELANLFTTKCNEYGD
jgi:hypothetical protein